eukprot:TRINITY_DN1416_c0_g1_i1.p3 TRINITY_DN1416_c0_g1~~TRINITY_DN1416_c0_g1_i1.p3  ORF type:complete len:166 (+),score=45.35 TRINITY_DN1416_c0_g1_i1:781-1278(+)
MGGCLEVEEVEVLPQWKLWMDEAQKMFGGLDILALDVLYVEKTDKYYILELNDTAIGIPELTQKEDNEFIRDIILSRAEQSVMKKKEDVALDQQHLIDEIMIYKIKYNKAIEENHSLKMAQKNLEETIQHSNYELQMQRKKMQKLVIIFFTIIVIFIGIKLQAVM